MKTIVNYKSLDNHLNKLNESQPERIHSHIDLLRANIRDKMVAFLSEDKLVIDTDYKTKTVKLGGKTIEGDIYAIYDDSKQITSSEIFYDQLENAKQQSRRLGIYDDVFSEDSGDEKQE